MSRVARTALAALAGLVSTGIAATAFAQTAVPAAAPTAPEAVQTGSVGATIAFYVLAALVLGGSLVTITRRNAVTAVMSLVGTFFALAALYTMLSAQFLAALQVLVYAGAIMTLFVFVVMLLNRDDVMPLGRRGIVSRALGAGLAIYGMVIVGSFLLGEHTQRPAAPPEHWGGVANVGEVLFRDYLFPFEAISILLIIAVIGAVVVARIPRKKTDEHSPLEHAGPGPGADAHGHDAAHGAH